MRLRSTYALTRKGVVFSQDFVVFSEAPLNVALLLCLDSAGTFHFLHDCW